MRIVNFEENVVSVNFGGKCMAVITESGKLFVSGASEYDEEPDDMLREAVSVAIKIDEEVVDVNCSVTDTTILTRSGEIISFDTLVEAPLLLPLKTKFKVVAIDFRMQHKGFITQKDTLYMFGLGDKGQLGCGKFRIKKKPTLVNLRQR